MIVGANMKLTKFGKLVRTYRLEKDFSLKDMADAIRVSSAYLSAMEYGERAVLPKHLDGIVNFLKKEASLSQIQEKELRESAAESKKVTLRIPGLSSTNHDLVAIFARKLQDGAIDQDFINELKE